MAKSGDPKSFAGRPTEKQKLLGQVLTPTELAREMAIELLRERPNTPVKILDPSVGPYTFPQAIIDCGLLKRGDLLTAVDIDADMINGSSLEGLIPDAEIRRINKDYLETQLIAYDYAILNPPYVRQEWLDRKLHYKELFRNLYSHDIPGTANLYVYFIVKVIEELKPKGRFACIVYDSWQSTLYGRWLSDFIWAHCKSVTVKDVPNQPFGKELIYATIIYATRNQRGSAANPQDTFDTARLSASTSPMADVDGFCYLDSLYSIQRGLRLKQANFFLCDLSKCKELGATPFVKKVSKLTSQYVVTNQHPEAALLVTRESSNSKAVSELNRRLLSAKKDPETHVSILTWFKERPDFWLFHRKAPYAPILFNYYLRNRPRHIYNPKRSFSDNFYGLKPLEGLSPLACFSVLNSTAICAEILAHARNQGSGLAKIQLFEYRRIRVPDLSGLSGSEQSRFEELGRMLIEDPDSSYRTIHKIDELIASIFPEPLLAVNRVMSLYKELDLIARKPKGKDHYGLA